MRHRRIVPGMAAVSRLLRIRSNQIHLAGDASLLRRLRKTTYTTYTPLLLTTRITFASLFLLFFQSAQTFLQSAFFHSAFLPLTVTYQYINSTLASGFFFRDNHSFVNLFHRRKGFHLSTCYPWERKLLDSSSAIIIPIILSGD